MARARIIFKGKVQGVWFRANSHNKAIDLGLIGSVRNLNNGDVEAICEGQREIILEFIEWNRSHQPFAKITDVSISWEPERGDLDGFRIIRT